MMYLNDRIYDCCIEYEAFKNFSFFFSLSYFLWIHFLKNVLIYEKLYEPPRPEWAYGCVYSAGPGALKGAAVQSKWMGVLCKCLQHQEIM